MALNDTGPIGVTMYFTIVGRQYEVTGEFTINPGGPKREPLPGLSGRGGGWTETIEDGSIDCTFATVPSLRVSDIRAMAGIAAQVECNNGHRYVTDTLYCQEADALDPVKGTFKAKFGTIGPMREV